MSDSAMDLVLRACAHARAKHGPRTIDHLPLHHRVSVLVEEVGEVARAVQDYTEHESTAGAYIKAEMLHDLRAELAQVAACALLWLEEEMSHV